MPIPVHGPCTTLGGESAAAAPPNTSLPVVTMATGLNQPDDLVQDDRRLLIGEIATGHVIELGANGMVTLPGNVGRIEGLAVLNGTLYAADQAGDRVVAVSAGGGQRTLIQLSPVAGVDGVDGIAAGGGEIVVPDAARGRVLWVRPDGTVTRTVAGFSRPAGAWVASDGSVLVADENLGGVYRIALDGTRGRIGGSLPEADDVVQDVYGDTYAVAVYVNGERLVKFVNGAWATLASGNWQPQGLATDLAGNPIVADYQSGQVLAFVTAFKLLAAASPIHVPPGVGVCLRTLGGPAQVQPGAGYRVAGITEIVPDPCPSACSIWVTATAGARTSGAWLRYATS